MLTVEALNYEYDAFSLRADFTLDAGRKTAVIGPSGGGKSTLLGLIAGFIAPVSGRILWDGVPWNDLPPGKRDISVLFQDNNLFPHLTVAQNVGLGLGQKLRLNAAQAQQVETVLARVGLTGLGGRKPANLSGGQQSRVALARVLLQDRGLVLLDEPFSALGPNLKAEMLDLVEALLEESGATLLMVSHDPEDAKRIADQVIFVNGGQVDTPIETGAFFNAPNEALKSYLL